MSYSYYYPDSSREGRGFIRVTGTGTVKAIPDTALVNLGIVTENTVLENARRENSIKTNTVINTLANLGIEKRSISTGAFSIDPIYDYIDGKQVLRGYRVVNILTVIVEDIARAGEVIDRATFAGVNRVDNISFTLSDITDYYDKALALAVENAIHKSTEIGKVLDVEVDRIPYKIIEKTDGPSLYAGAAAKLASPTTPVLPGQIEIVSTIVAIIGFK